MSIPFGKNCSNNISCFHSTDTTPLIPIKPIQTLFSLNDPLDLFIFKSTAVFQFGMPLPAFLGYVHFIQSFYIEWQKN